jgi:CBS domain-containing protein
MTIQRDDASIRESGNPGGGKGRRDETGKSGVYPASGPWPEGDAPIQPMASFGQGGEGAAGYAEAGRSEIADAEARERIRAQSAAPTAGLTCRDVMTEDLAFCLLGDTVRRAAELMRARDVGVIPVVADPAGRRLAGVVTDRDLALRIVAEACDANTVTVGAVMTPNPAACRPEDDIEKAMHLMEAKQVRRLPIVDAAGHLVGIVAQADLARRVARKEKIAEVVEEISQPGAGGRESRGATPLLTG